MRRMAERKLQEITRLQKQMFDRFRSVPREGVLVTYEEKNFIVFPNVFWPFEDSKALVKSFVIRPNETVLDIGTGSGVLAVFSAYKGAGKVVAVDINLAAVENAKANAKFHGFEKIIETRLSNLFETLKEGEKFDVVIANLPFRDKRANDVIELAMWDTDFSVNKKFFSEVANHLEKTGRIYLAQANFGEVEKVLELAHNAGFKEVMIGEYRVFHDDPRIFYAFVLHSPPHLRR